MPEYVARERLYHTADRSEVVKEGDPKAAFLLVSEGTQLSEGEVKRLKLEGYFEEAPAADPSARTQARYDDAVARGAFEEAASHEAALGRNRMAAESGATERVVLERGRAGQATAGVPTPVAEKAPRRAAAAESKADAPAPAPAAARQTGEKK